MGKTISEHAAYELTKAGLTNDPDPNGRQVAINTLALIRRFEKMNMHERQARYVIDAFATLTNLLPLTPLTDDPDEWDKFNNERKNLDTDEVETKELWQSRRATSIFSEDKGKTWYDAATGKTGESLDHVAEEKAMAALRQKQESVGRKPSDAVEADVPAEEQTLATADPTTDEEATPITTPEEGTTSEESHPEAKS